MIITRGSRVSPQRNLTDYRGRARANTIDRVSRHTRSAVQVYEDGSPG